MRCRLCDQVGHSKSNCTMDPEERAAQIQDGVRARRWRRRMHNGIAEIDPPKNALVPLSSSWIVKPT